MSTNSTNSFMVSKADRMGRLCPILAGFWLWKMERAGVDSRSYRSIVRGAIHSVQLKKLAQRSRV